MNVLELRQIVETLLEEQLGTYALGDGEYPAVVVQDSGESLARDRVVSGLEVRILKTPMARRPQATFGGVQRVKTWQLFLVQYSEGEQTLELAEQRLEQRFPNAVFAPVKLEKQESIREQISVKIPDLTEYAEVLR